MTDFATRAVHGEDGARDETIRPHVGAIHQTTSFTFPSARDGVRAFEGSGAYLYSRKANPTVVALERHLTALETVPVETPAGPRAPGADDVGTLVFGSGMAAISATVLGIAAGGRVVCQAGIYGTTEAMVGGLERFGAEVEFARVADLDDLRRVVGRGAPPALVYVETPANPLVQATDIAAAAGIAHEAGALLAVDSTFATPALQRPLAWGADLVLHSTTKFIAGHGVTLGGSVTGPGAVLGERIEPMRVRFGGIADPFAAWLTLLGARTLALRMDRNSSNADRLADFLDAHDRIVRVHRPDLDALPDGQMATRGPMLAFEVEGGEAAALDLIDRLELITLAPTLGDVDTLIQHPWTMSHAVLPEARRRDMGIGPGVLRVSTGVEAPGDLIDDLERALAG